jgi:F420-0:gamma-glutamyl ligase-like protein
LKVKARSIRTRYWRPRTDYAAEIVASIRERVSDGDVVLISEKAQQWRRLIVDEAAVKPKLFANWLAAVWIRDSGRTHRQNYKTPSKTMENLKKYPIQRAPRTNS